MTNLQNFHIHLDSANPGIRFIQHIIPLVMISIWLAPIIILFLEPVLFTSMSCWARTPILRPLLLSRLLLRPQICRTILPDDPMVLPMDPQELSFFLCNQHNVCFWKLNHPFFLGNQNFCHTWVRTPNTSSIWCLLLEKRILGTRAMGTKYNLFLVLRLSTWTRHEITSKFQIHLISTRNPGWLIRVVP